MPTVFISHSSRDQAAARAVCAVLEQAGLSCWVSYRDIHGGKWANEIAVALAKSHAMVLLVSEYSLASEHVEDEFSLAKDRRVPMVAIRLDATHLPPGMELGLRKWQQLRIGPDGVTASGAQIVRAVREILPKQGPAAAQPQPAPAPAARPSPAEPVAASGGSRPRMALLAVLGAGAVAVVAAGFGVRSILDQEPVEPGPATCTLDPIPSTREGATVSLRGSVESQGPVAWQILLDGQEVTSGSGSGAATSSFVATVGHHKVEIRDQAGTCTETRSMVVLPERCGVLEGQVTLHPRGLEPMEVWCQAFAETPGDNWMLVAARTAAGALDREAEITRETKGIRLTPVPDGVLRQAKDGTKAHDKGLYLEDRVWAVLRKSHSEVLLEGHGTYNYQAEPGKRLTWDKPNQLLWTRLDAFGSGTCVTLGSLGASPVVHAEVNGCTGTGSDYSTFGGASDWGHQRPTWSGSASKGPVKFENNGTNYMEPATLWIYIR